MYAYKYIILSKLYFVWNDENEVDNAKSEPM